MSLLNGIKSFLRNPFIYSFVVLFSFATPVLADTNSSLNTNTVTNSYTFKELGWNSSVTLNGYQPNYTFYLPLAKSTHPKKLILHLKANFSSLLSEDTRLDIKLNQSVLRRISLPADLTQELNLDIELPLNQLSKEWQSLTFMGYLSGSKSLCNPNLWIYISPESSITVTTVNTPFAATLNQLPDLFINPVTLNPSSLLLLFPPKARQQEIFSLLYLALHLGKQASTDKIQLRAANINQLSDEEKNHNLILVGLREQLALIPEATSALSTPALHNSQNAKAGFIILRQSPFNEEYGLLTLTGHNNTALNKAIEAFFIPEFKQMVTGQEAVVNEVQTNKQAKTVPQWYETTLKTLGYKNQSVSGLGHHEVSYTITLPNDRIPGNATLKTYITTPGFSLNDHSRITLIVNGIKQASFNLTQEHSAWPVNINASAMKPGVNSLQYLLNLHLDNEQCSLKNYDEVWATIHAETEFTTLFSDKFPKASLNQLPVPFSNEISLIVPDELSEADINNLTQLMFTFGRLMHHNFISFNFLSSSTATEEYLRSHNTILYGLPEKNRWVQFAFDYMPFRLVNKERHLNLNQKKLVISAQTETGLLELVSSPWHSRREIFLISGSNEAELVKAVQVFADDKTRATLDGNIAIINPDQSVQVINSDNPQHVPIKSQVSLYLKNWLGNLLFYIKYHPQLFIYLLVFIVPLYIYLRQRKSK